MTVIATVSVHPRIEPAATKSPNQMNPCFLNPTSALTPEDRTAEQQKVCVLSSDADRLTSHQEVRSVLYLNVPIGTAKPVFVRGMEYPSGSQVIGTTTS